MLSTVSCLLALMPGPAKYSYTFDAQFVEGCSCKDICVTEITGRDAGCHGIGAMRFRRGTYNGKDFSGSTVAWAWDSGKWVRLYVDAPSSKRAAATDFMKAILADWGKLEGVSASSVKISRAGKGYTAVIDGGKEGAITIVPVFGRDGATAVTHTNLTSPLHSILNQGETKSASFRNPAHAFKLDKTNGFYNPSTRMAGKI